LLFPSKLRPDYQCLAATTHAISIKLSNMKAGAIKK